MEYHNPVLLKETVDGLSIKPTGIYVDLTFGGGGHSKEILKYLTTGKLLAFDQDTDAVKNIIPSDNFIFVHSNFKYLKNYLKYYGYTKVDGILADLGISSHHINMPERGFSFRFNAPLDMRMNQNAKLSAYNVVNEYDEEILYKIFREYGEIKSVGRLVKSIVENRISKPINTTFELVDIISNLAPKHKEHKFFAQVFQAIRIEVNAEIKVLEEMLEQCGEVLKSGGRLSILSYHSLEDKLVKKYIKTGNVKGEIIKDNFGNFEKFFKPINKKIIVPTEEEIKINNRARSAKLRIAEKL